VGGAFAGDDPDGDFAHWLEDAQDARPGIELRRISWEAQRNELLAGSRQEGWLQDLEGLANARRTSISVAAATALPAAIAHALGSEIVRGSAPLVCRSVRVGQGLRTGCNPFFYVEVAEGSGENGMVKVLASKLFGGRPMELPASILKPVLRKQAEVPAMIVERDLLRGRLLDLRGLVLPEDASEFELAGRDGLLVMPEVLASFVRLAARTTYIRGRATRTPIPNLSAVRTNGLGPDDLGRLSSPPKGGVLRMWYMVPDLAPRHSPSLCVPRVVHEEPRAILNARPPVLIDANFSTLWAEKGACYPETIFAVLNSTWGEFCMEALGATLGGGALKLEATHLRQLPFPLLSGQECELLRNITREAIDSARVVEAFGDYRAKIDHVVVSSLAQRRQPASKTQETVDVLSGLISSLRARRRRGQSLDATE
jgi:hypothetical protein